MKLSFLKGMVSPVAKDLVTGVSVMGRFVEWTSFRKLKGAFEKTDSGSFELAAETAPASETPQEPAALEKEAYVAVSSPAEAVPVEPAAIEPAPVETERPRFDGAIRIGLPSDHLILRVAELPAVTGDELAEMVRLQMDKHSPFPIENMVVSHEVLGTREGASTVLMAAARQDKVEELGKKLGDAGIASTSVDADVLGWWRILADAGDIVAQGRQIFLLLHDGVPEILALQDGVPAFFRSFGESRSAADPDFADEMALEIGYTLMALELDKGPSEACAIFVCYRGDEPVGLLERLGRECPCDVVPRPMDNLPPLSEGLARRATAAEDLLDLTPAAWKEREKAGHFKRQMFVAVAAAAGVWCVCAVAFLGLWYFHVKKLDWLTDQRARLQKPEMEVRETRRRVAIIRRYMDRSHSLLECLREISSVLPEGATLTSFTYRKGEEVAISGEAANVNLVYDFKKRMDESQLFKGVSLQGPRHDARTGKEIFDINLKLPGGEP